MRSEEEEAGAERCRRSKQQCSGRQRGGAPKELLSGTSPLPGSRPITGQHFTERDPPITTRGSSGKMASLPGWHRPDDLYELAYTRD